MKIFVGDLRFFKDYLLEDGPISNFTISISPVVDATSLEIKVDHTKGIQRNFSFKGDYYEHSAIADAFEEIARVLREHFDPMDEDE